MLALDDGVLGIQRGVEEPELNPTLTGVGLKEDSGLGWDPSLLLTAEDEIRWVEDGQLHDELTDREVVGVELVHALGVMNAVVTNRHLDSLYLTTDWLARVNFPYDILRMNGESHPTSTWKIGQVEDLKRSYDVVLLVDDWPGVYPDMAQLGVTALIVTPPEVWETITPAAGTPHS